jgi:hypothetical protein
VLGRAREKKKKNRQEEERWEKRMKLKNWNIFVAIKNRERFQI